tara:strand:- start:119 stop:412 length:294 start_codon:yes stop_codon:yes gene_type:complete
MKFAALTVFVAAVVATEGETCDDATVADVCTEEGACCGFKTDAADITRVCSGAAEASPSDIEDPVSFSCADPAAAMEEGASRLAIAGALLSAIYFAN